MAKDYKQITVRDIVELVKNEPDNFPKGLDTPIASGDFEGNYLHCLHELMNTSLESGERAVFIGYEMHESNGIQPWE